MLAAGDLRLRIAGRQDFVHAAVTVLALGHVGISGGCSFGVDAMIVSRLLVGVTGGAYRLGRSWIVGKGLDVGVAVGAAEHAVDRSP